jgi:cation transporter-like permease
MVFIEGMNAVAPGSGVVNEALANIGTDVLLSGFSLAFLFGCGVSIALLLVAILARQEIHPDYQPVPAGTSVKDQS